MALSTQLRQRACVGSVSSSSSSSLVLRSSSLRARPAARRMRVAAAAATEQPSEGTKTLIQKAPGTAEMPFPWTEKDPYRLPVSIDRVQRMLLGLGWEKPWVEQIIDRVMKGMLRTNEERAKAVVDYLASIGLAQDQICNMASISVVLLGLNPETRLAAVVDYLKRRGVPAAQVPDVVLKHPRIFEYKVVDGAPALSKGAARIQVDAVPLPGGAPGAVAVAVNYFREGAAFVGAPVSPLPPAPAK